MMREYLVRFREGLGVKFPHSTRLRIGIIKWATNDNNNDKIFNTYDMVYIEETYNQKRLHSSLDYRPPVYYEEEVEKMDKTDRPVLIL